MTHRLLHTALLIAAMTAGCAQPQADDLSLRDSFADRVSESNFVNDFTREGDELNFSGPDGDGGSAEWRVRIETSLVEPNLFDETMPYQGRITSEWTANGELVEYLGNMTALPKDFLDRGLGQECWAYWVEAESRWDW
jgi:hypothetical protein